jgi:4-amino-4-deoxy-L-arabinose transferase-like glycosyltransferase
LQEDANAVYSGAIAPLRRSERLVLLAIVLLGAAIRLYGLDAQSLWYDETFSVAHSARALPELFEVLTHDVVHPPLHYLVLHGWFKTISYSAFQARLVSAIFGTLSVALLFALARRFTSTPVSLVAAFLLAVSQIGVYFSQEARPYALAQLTSLLAALAFLAFLREPDLRRSLAFFAAGAALLYTHYYGAGTLLALGVYWLIYRREYSPLVPARLAAVVALLAIAYAPWVIAVESRGRLSQERLISTSRDPSTRPNLMSPLGALNRFNSGKFSSIEGTTTLPQAVFCLVVFSVPAAGALWYTRRGRAHGAVLGILLASVPVCMAILCGALGFIFNYRHYSFAVPGYYLAVAIGWQLCLRHKAARFAWIAVVVGTAAMALRANHVVTKPDYRAGFLPLAQNYRPGDCVAGQPRIWNDRVHLGWEVYYSRVGVLRLVPFDELQAAHVNCERLWIVRDKTWWMNRDQRAGQVQADAVEKLKSRYAILGSHDHPAISLQLMALRPQSASE